MLRNHTTDSLFESLHTAGASVRLTDAARSRMRSELIAYAELHAPEARASRTRLIDPLLAFSYLSRSGRGFVMASLALFVIVGGGSTLAEAAERALPGDPLYPVKLSVNEPLAATFATTPSAKASFHAKLAEKRVDEAVELAGQGKLTPAVEASVATRIARAVEKADDAAEELEAAGDATASLAVRDELATHLASRAESFDDASAPVMMKASFADTEADETGDASTVRGVVHAKLIAFARARGDLAIAVAPQVEVPTAEARVAIARKSALPDEPETTLAPSAKLMMMTFAADATTTDMEASTTATTTATTTDADASGNRFFKAIRSFFEAHDGDEEHTDTAE